MRGLTHLHCLQNWTDCRQNKPRCRQALRVDARSAVKTSVPHSSGGVAPRRRDLQPIARSDPVQQVGPTCLPTSPLCTRVTSEDPLERHGRKQHVLSLFVVFRLLFQAASRPLRSISCRSRSPRHHFTPHASTWLYKRLNFQRVLTSTPFSICEQFVHSPPTSQYIHNHEQHVRSRRYPDRVRRRRVCR